MRVTVGAPVNLNAPVLYYYPFQTGAFTVVPSCLMFVLLVVLVLFSQHVCCVFIPRKLCVCVGGGGGGGGGGIMFSRCASIRPSVTLFFFQISWKCSDG